MKKIISVLLTVCLMLTVVSAGFVFAHAEKINGTDIEWSFDNTTKTLTISGSGAIPDYSYSGGINPTPTYPWKNISYETVVFSDGITAIGNYAFCYSKSLKTVNLPSAVTALGTGVFFNCKALESASLSDGIKVIPDKLFDGCSALKSVTIPADAEAIGNRAFYNTALESVAFPNTLKSIGDEAFSQCSKLTDAVMPDALKTIGESAFSGCEALKTLVLNQGLESIGESAFSWCVELKSLSIPASVSTIPENLCDYDSALDEVVISEGVKAIAAKAFFRCPMLKSITIPGSVESIGEKALGYAKTLSKTDGFEITGYEDTQAKIYADEYKFTFVSSGTYYSGSLNGNINWSFDSKTKTLTLSGSGAMFGEYNAENLPVYIERFPQIDNIQISDEIIFITDYAFYNLGKDCKISPLNCISIGENAFFNTGSAVELSPRVKGIGDKGVGQYDADGNADPEFTVIGTKFSYAQNFAKDNGFKFELAAPSELSGSCGDNAEWSFNPETGELVISGSGEISSFTQSELPAYSYYDVQSITISPAITAVGDYAFFGLEKVNPAEINPGIVSIGEKSFGYTFDADGNETVIEGFSVKGYDNSYAKIYAEAENFKFVSMGQYQYTTGKLGENIEWTYNKDTETLTVSGTGATDDFTADNLPIFSDYSIKTIIISDSVEKLGSCVFLNVCAENIDVSDTVAEIGDYAFGYKFDTDYAKIDNFTVICMLDSAAHKYAENNGLSYIIADLFALPDTLPLVIDEAAKTIFVYDNKMSKETFISACTVGKGYEVVFDKDTISTDSTLEIKFKDETVKKYAFIVNGDVNCDGVVNSTDALNILLHVVQKTPLVDKALVAADLNSDTSVDSTDALLALQISVNEITPQSLLPKKQPVNE